MPSLDPNTDSIHVLWRNGKPMRAYEEKERGDQDLSLLKLINVGGAYSLEAIPLFKHTQALIERKQLS